MTAKHSPATSLPPHQVAPYFLDQYGHIYRWHQKDDQTVESVSVANFQNYGSAKESGDLIDKANAYPRAIELLQYCADHAGIGNPLKGSIQAFLLELGEAE